MDRLADMEVSSLVLLTRANDNFAFSELVKRYTPMINGVISGFAFPKSRVAEAESEAYVALYRAAMTYDVASTEVTFGLYARICVHRRLCDFASAVTGQEVSIDEVEPSELSDSCVIESELVDEETMRECIAKARDILSDYEYSVFRLYLNGYTTREIAELLSRSPKSVDNAKNRMMKHLRKHSSSFFD